MKTNLVVSLFAVVLLMGCKADKKEDSVKVVDSNKEEPAQIEEKNLTFEDKLLDYRDVNRQFVEGYSVEKFGIQKINDSIFGLVFKLDNATTSSTVDAYSIGVKIFDLSLEKPMSSSFHPNIKEIEGSKYVVLPRKFTKLDGMDSLDVYVYNRKNWKGSGRLGSFKIRDVVFK